MPEVAFHTGIGDKTGYACRLLRKAWRQRQRVAVFGDAAALARLDTALWLFEPQEFVPHARLAAGCVPSAAMARTPIWLLEPGAQPPYRDVLVNLGPDLPDEADQFARVLELVDDSDDDRLAGRRRWQAYKSRGWTVVHHPQPLQG